MTEQEIQKVVAKTMLSIFASVFPRESRSDIAEAICANLDIDLSIGDIVEAGSRTTNWTLSIRR